MLTTSTLQRKTLLFTILLLTLLISERTRAQADATLGIYFPLELGNEWIYDGHETIRVDTVVSRRGRMYYHLTGSLPVWVKYHGRYRSDYLLRNDEKGNVYALVGDEERPLMLFDQREISTENYFGWEDVLLEAVVERPRGKFPFRDRFCPDGVVVEYNSPAQRGKTWVFCKDVGLVWFEEYDHGRYKRFTLASYKVKRKGERK
ncbi:MAG: hypothetical protein HYR76_10925 [Ignavibacteria bacterium]|nr:hypothetical protein [Ignavibacteria bacterium]